MGTPQLFEKLAIFGVGLIGGSVALAMRQAGQVGTIVGVGRSGDTLQEALALGVIDRAELPEIAVEGADMVLLATPVGQFEPILRTIAPHLMPHAVITDAGSTKGDVVASMRAALPALIHRCVPAHPIAGAEKSGVTAARADLFQGKNVVLTPLPETESSALDKARAFWRACGAQLVEMSVEEHDRIFAAVSHLPHLLAYALVDAIARRPDAERILGFAAGGFRDFSRIASSSPEMWRDISLANRDALLSELDAYQAELALLRRLLAERDGAALEALFHNARRARDAWIKNSQTQRP
ncbi:MAG: prephenate dehydrogenase/arogenate dehydrogenase family protein [Methylophilaceae bacterium]|nr:prephenate dehydrogenase/arogenate dehydrogenase family protein [Methylophilaceae bacterium]